MVTETYLLKNQKGQYYSEETHEFTSKENATKYTTINEASKRKNKLQKKGYGTCYIFINHL